ncbi:hypothetical protein pb186bvf_016631 [Paramecium bursaria]
MYYLGKCENAILDYTIVININQQNARAYKNRGQCYLVISQEMHCVNQVDTVRPQKIIRMLLIQIHKPLRFIKVEVVIILIYLQGLIMNKLERNKEAIIDFTKAININPQYAKAYFYRGQDYLVISQGLVQSKLNEYPEAIQDYNKSIDINPNCDNIYCLRGLY